MSHLWLFPCSDRLKFQKWTSCHDILSYYSLIPRSCGWRKNGMISTFCTCKTLPDFMGYCILLIVHKPLTYLVTLTSASQLISPVQKMPANNHGNNDKEAFSSFLAGISHAFVCCSKTPAHEWYIIFPFEVQRASKQRQFRLQNHPNVCNREYIPLHCYLPQLNWF